MMDNPLPPGGHARLVRAEQVELVEHPQAMTAVGLDERGRLFAMVRGRGVRLTMTAEQLLALAVLLGAAAEEMVDRGERAAAQAAEALDRLTAAPHD
jgi:hypothetical protein